jgi:hypothetical protein
MQGLEVFVQCVNMTCKLKTVIFTHLESTAQFRTASRSTSNCFVLLLLFSPDA